MSGVSLILLAGWCVAVWKMRKVASEGVKFNPLTNVVTCADVFGGHASEHFGVKVDSSTLDLVFRKDGKAASVPVSVIADTHGRHFALTPTLLKFEKGVVLATTGDFSAEVDTRQALWFVQLMEASVHHNRRKSLE